jgi:hypothetical protein
MAGPVITPATKQKPENRWLTLVAATSWLCLTLLTLGLFIASLPARYAVLANPNKIIHSELEAYSISLTFYTNFIIATHIVVAVGFLAAAAAVALLTRCAPRALFVSLTLTTFGAALPGASFAIIIGQPISDVPFSLLQGLGWFFLLLFAYLFPSGRLAPAWTRYLVPLWAAWVCVFFALSPTAFAQRPVLIGLFFLMWVGWFVTGAYAQYRRYISVDTDIERYQTRWAVLGFFVAIFGAMIATLPHIAALSLGRPELVDVRYQLIATAVMSICGLFIPATITAAMLRRRLFDVDLIINRALVYGALSATLAFVYGVCITAVVGLGAAVSGRFSVNAAQHPLTLISATLVVAALAQPLRRRIQRDINRRFYRRQFNMQRILETFGAELKQEIELEQLGERLLQIVSRAMQPSHVSLWLTPIDSSKSARSRARLEALDKQLSESEYETPL